MASLNWKQKKRKRLKVHDDGEAWNLWRLGEQLSPLHCATFCCLTQVTIQWDGQGVGLKSGNEKKEIE